MLRPEGLKRDVWQWQKEEHGAEGAAGDTDKRVVRVSQVDATRILMSCYLNEVPAFGNCALCMRPCFVFRPIHSLPQAQLNRTLYKGPHPNFCRTIMT